MNFKNTKLFFALFLSLIILISTSLSVFAADNVKILSSKNYASNQVNETKIVALINDLFKLNSNSYAFNQARVKPIFLNENNSTPEYLVVYLLKKDSYYFETKRVNLNSDYSVKSIQENYLETTTDREGFEMPYQASYADDDVTAVFATCCNDIPSAVAGVNEATKTAQAAGYTVRTLVGATATVNAYKYWLSKPNVKIFGNIGHGSPSGIVLADGTLDNNYFNSLATTALNNKVLYFNSCQVHNNPLEGAILHAGVQKFIGGNINLYIGSSEEVFKYFWTLTLSKGQAMTPSLTQAENDTNYPDKGAHGISGNGSDYVTTISFTNPIQYYPSGWNFGIPSTWQTIMGDFNGDNKTDYARLGATYAHLFFSNGDGTFSNPIQYYPSGWDFGNPSNWEPITGDFNGDGKTDYARLGGTYTHLFFSNGDGTFTNPIQYYPSGWDFGFPSKWKTITGDFNGDGKTDYARLGGTYAHLFFSNGDGTFTNLIQSYPSGWDFGIPSSWDTITGDFNGDGKTDYARLGATYAHLFFSNGDGTFSNPIQYYPSGWNFGIPSSWETITGDFNGDNKTDYARLGGTYAHFFFSNGDGTFSNPIHYYPTGWDFGFPSKWKTIVGDFNGDRKVDYARLGGTYSHFFFSNGNGTFTNPIQYYPAGWDFGIPSPWETTTGNFNGDKKTDYIRLGGTYSHLFISQSL